MATTTQRPSLIAIVGPTASGKSDLALKIAQEFDGEIIAADSRTIYKGMDVGTAKPGKTEQKLVPHWGLDLIEPGQPYSAHLFKKYAEQKIEEVQKRGNLPVLVGGSGLYIDSVLFDFEFVNKADQGEREQLEKLTAEQLQKLIKEQNYPMPENKNNRRHLVRTIERKGLIGTKRSLNDNMVIIGLSPDAESLKKRIFKRAETYFEQGILQETKELLNKYSEDELKKTHGIAYIASIKLLKGEITQDEALEMVQRREWQYARRQRTWFKRNESIKWFEFSEQAFAQIAYFLNN